MIILIVGMDDSSAALECVEAFMKTKCHQPVIIVDSIPAPFNLPFEEILIKNIRDDIEALQRVIYDEYLESILVIHPNVRECIGTELRKTQSNTYNPNSPIRGTPIVH